VDPDPVVVDRTKLVRVVDDDDRRLACNAMAKLPPLCNRLVVSVLPVAARLAADLLGAAPRPSADWLSLTEDD
jgi:hypothetical protein